MTVQTDPIDIAQVDENETLQATLPLAEAANGFADDQELPADKFNSIARSAAIWKRWLDQGKAPVEQTIGTVSCRLSAAEFEFTAVPGLVQDLVADSHYLVLGRYVALTTDRLEAAGLAAYVTGYTFTASKDEHFYIEADGTISSSVVALGTPAAPGVGQEWLCTVETNATDINSQTTGDAFLVQRVYVEQLHAFADEAQVTDTGGGTATLAFKTEADPGEGWLIATGANGSELTITERNTLEVAVVNFGSDSLPVEFNRAISALYDVAVEGDLTGGTTEVVRVRSHDATATENTWHNRRTTWTGLNLAKSASHNLDGPNFGGVAGTYAGRLRVVVIDSTDQTAIASRESHVIFSSTGAASTLVNQAMLYNFDNIGLTLIALTATGNTIRVTVSIPNLAGTPTFNVLVEADLQFVSIS